MEESDARKLVAFFVVVYNLAGAFVIYTTLVGWTLKTAGELMITVFTLPVTFISLIYLNSHPEPWFPVIIIQLAMLGLFLYLFDLCVRFFQR